MCICISVFVSDTALTALLLPRVLISLLRAVAHPLSLLQHFGFVIIITVAVVVFVVVDIVIFIVVVVVVIVFAVAHPLSLLQQFGFVIIIIIVDVVVVVIFIFSYASSSTPHPCQRLSRWVIVSD